MNEIEIRIGRRKWLIELPDSWESCTRKLYREVCWLLVIGRFDTPHMRRWLVKYTKIPRRAVARMSESEINAILQCLKWSVDPPKHASGKFGWWWFWRGPLAGFQNVDAVQYGMADQHFKKYLDAVKEQDAAVAKVELRNLAAMVLTPFGIRYRPWLAEAQKVVFRMMPMRMRMVVLYEFWGMTNFLAGHFPLAFSRRKKGGGKDYGWPGMFEAMAGEKFGPMSQVKSEKIYDIFLHIEQSLQREKEAEKERRKKGRK